MRNILQFFFDYFLLFFFVNSLTVHYGSVLSLSISFIIFLYPILVDCHILVHNVLFFSFRIILVYYCSIVYQVKYVYIFCYLPIKCMCKTNNSLF